MALKYYLDRKTSFGEETEYKSLYGWFLQEQDAEGKPVGRKYIPFSWSLNFHATEATYTEQLSIETHGTLRLVDTEEEKEKPDELKVEERRNIRAILKPGYLNDTNWRKERYSMFGTDRELKDIALRIYEVDEGEAESCHAWGSPSYDAGDYSPEPTEDCLLFTLMVARERFNRYVEMIERCPANMLTLRVGMVSGMYAEWSPEIHASKLKVLANLEDQQIILPESPKFLPPALGKVGKCDLYFITNRQFDKPIEVPENLGLDEGEEKPRSPEETGLALQKADLQLSIATAKRIKQLQYAAWVIAALLFLILVK